MNDEHVEKALEVGLQLVGALLLGGLGLLVFGRAGGDMLRGKRQAERPPSRGQVSSERHQNIAASSPR
jgi:hypothetical protein